MDAGKSFEEVIRAGGEALRNGDPVEGARLWEAALRHQQKPNGWDELLTEAMVGFPRSLMPPASFRELEEVTARLLQPLLALAAVSQAAVQIMQDLSILLHYWKAYDQSEAIQDDLIDVLRASGKENSREARSFFLLRASICSPATRAERALDSTEMVLRALAANGTDESYPGQADEQRSLCYLIRVKTLIEIGRFEQALECAQQFLAFAEGEFAEAAANAAPGDHQARTCCLLVEALLLMAKTLQQSDTPGCQQHLERAETLILHQALPKGFRSVLFSKLSSQNAAAGNKQHAIEILEIALKGLEDEAERRGVAQEKANLEGQLRELREGG